MATVIWSPQALDDLERHREYIARDSAHHAKLFVSRAFVATERLTTFPFSGREVPEINSETSREIIHGAYRIMYEVGDDEVTITTVVDGAMDWHPESE